MAHTNTMTMTITLSIRTSDFEYLQGTQCQQQAVSKLLISPIPQGALAGIGDNGRGDYDDDGGYNGNEVDDGVYNADEQDLQMDSGTDPP